MSPADLATLRLALSRELETLNLYQELADRAAAPELKALLLHVMDEEQEHVAEFATMLRAGDAALARAWGEAHPQARSLTAPGWTVGSLLEAEGPGP